MQYNKYTDTPWGRKLANCEARLERPLSYGEMVDFILDNCTHNEFSIEEANTIRDGCVIWFGRTENGKRLWDGQVISAAIIIAGQELCTALGVKPYERRRHGAPPFMMDGIDERDHSFSD